MNQLFLNSAAAGVAVSLAGYFVGTALKKRLGWAILNPLLVSIILVIGVLLLLDIEYESYNYSAKYLSYLLKPATVCLAIPLYQKLELLKKNFAAIMAGILAGVLTSLVSVLVIAIICGLSHAGYVTLLPKSITTAIGMGLAEELGGYSEITAAVIIITGVFGNMAAEPLCRFFKIRNAISRGLAIGTSAHAIGTARAMEMGETEGAMSSLAIVVSGVCTVVGASIFAGLL